MTDGLERIPVAILGATGAVGQTFIRLLAQHPWFRVAEVAASERSAGKRYADAAQWLEGELPADVASLTVVAPTPDAISARLVFSALDPSVAGDVEAAFARAGRVVCSNAKNHRMVPDVPLLIPEINAPHVDVIAAQQAREGWTGALVTNANCSSTVATLALAPIHEAFGVRTLFIATMQAVSGAGYPGVASLDILGNVIPFIADEEPKIEAEIPKLLGRVDGASIRPASIRASAHANRVAVVEGHTVCMSIGLERPVSVADVRDAITTWQGRPEAFTLPSRPERLLLVDDEVGHPQPRRDVMRGGGMTVTVGRVREDPLLDIRLVAMGSNTIRGAAGGAILNAELLVERGIVARG